jgi:methionyl-tRNA formyltransferase
MEQELTSRTRIVFLSSGGILGDIVLRRLLESGKFEVAGIVRSRRVMLRGAGFLRGAIAYFARCGIIYTVYIWTITTFAEFVGLFTGIGSITRRARENDIPVLHAQDVNERCGQEFIAACRPDLLVSAHFDQRLDPPLCDRHGHAAVNIHPSLLPDHRGLEPVLHTMRRGGSEFGVTVHRIAVQIDTGMAVAAAELAADKSDSVLRVTRDLMKTGADLLVAHTEQAHHPGTSSPQERTGSYHSWPSGPDIAQLYRTGRHLMKPRDFAFLWRKT